MKRVARHAVSFAACQKLVHLLLRVRCLGIAHARSGIAKAPFGQERRPSGEPGETADYFRHARPGDHVVVENPMVGDETPEGAVIGGEFTTEVERAVREGVIKDAERETGARPARDVERQVLVERVG